MPQLPNTFTVAVSAFFYVSKPVAANNNTIAGAITMICEKLKEGDIGRLNKRYIDNNF